MRNPSHERIHAEALRMWREREMGYPTFVRRMTPDDLDYASGAWARVYAAAMEKMRAAPRLLLAIIVAGTLAHAVDGLMSPDVPGTQGDNGGHSGTLERGTRA